MQWMTRVFNSKHRFKKECKYSNSLELFIVWQKKSNNEIIAYRFVFINFVDNISKKVSTG
jgi:hypothetical protein